VGLRVSGYCAVQVASNMALCCASGKQHGIRIAVSQSQTHDGVRACIIVFVRVCCRSVSVGDYLTMLSLKVTTEEYGVLVE